jgi:hypothetical protein
MAKIETEKKKHFNTLETIFCEDKMIEARSKKVRLKYANNPVFLPQVPYNLLDKSRESMSDNKTRLSKNNIGATKSLLRTRTRSLRSFLIKLPANKPTIARDIGKRAVSLGKLKGSSIFQAETLNVTTNSTEITRNCITLSRISIFMKLILY